MISDNFEDNGAKYSMSTSQRRMDPGFRQYDNGSESRCVLCLTLYCKVSNLTEHDMIWKQRQLALRVKAIMVTINYQEYNLTEQNMISFKTKQNKLTLSVYATLIIDMLIVWIFWDHWKMHAHAGSILSSNIITWNQRHLKSQILVTLMVLWTTTVTQNKACKDIRLLGKKLT